MLEKDEIKEEEDFEQIVHPNLEQEPEEPRRRAKSYLLPDGPEPGSWADSWFVKWFAKFDETKLRPFLIRDYDVMIALMEDEYQDLIQNKFDDKN